MTQTHRKNWNQTRLLLRFGIPGWGKFLLLLTLSFLLVVGLELPSWGQFTMPGLGNNNTNNPPSNVIRSGDIEIARVMLDGSPLFFVTAPTVLDRDNPGDQMPVEIRAELIEFSLQRVLTSNEIGTPNPNLIFTTLDPKKILVGVATLNKETVISVRTNELQNPQKILTVTATDSLFYGMPIADLAEDWRGRIQTALRQAAHDRSPQALTNYFQKSFHALLILLALSVGLFWLKRYLKGRLKHLKEQFEFVQAGSTPEPDHQSISSVTNPLKVPTQSSNAINRWLSQQLSSPKLYLLDKRIKITALGLFILTWGQVAIWLIGGVYIFNLFPWTRYFAWRFLGLPISWLVIWFVSGLVNSLGDLALKRLGQIWHNYPKGDTDIQRSALRIGTTLTVLGDLKTTIVYGVALGLVIGSLGIPVGSVIAIGGLLAFALSLGAQSLVRDLINGAFIIWEDQFGIGDVVVIGDVSGAVENMNLRITQLRNGEGRLITIPNSAISVVENLTRTWSRVDFTIDIDSQTPAHQALDCLKQVTTELYTDPAWHEKILEPPEVLGIEQLTHSGLSIRIWIKTKPGQQWAVGRELRQRVQRTMLKAGLEIGRPQQTLINPQNGKINGLSHQQANDPS
ncbi:mechanosensitive ion channel family protein [Synechococcus sp. PCC 6312]|uniref:mechanosensitive ion channel family protein n=1 Tax=Synechococcus sp. (strain ATCC 27167 / PCC 6312) TaxID=195253 RepID=UPI00029F2615|nr:mechanosensitive ion channel family protein [Synechococcus sp. PCC 6312]AFY60788.1 small-conductance mechanosensitive channel [Synechococcus sp. PCC 6312]